MDESDGKLSGEDSFNDSIKVNWREREKHIKVLCNRCQVHLKCINECILVQLSSHCFKFPFHSSKTQRYLIMQFHNAAGFSMQQFYLQQRGEKCFINYLHNFFSSFWKSLPFKVSFVVEISKSIIIIRCITIRRDMETVNGSTREIETCEDICLMQQVRSSR